jgi:hypothetical protein
MRYLLRVTEMAADELILRVGLGVDDLPAIIKTHSRVGSFAFYTPHQVT